jgi:hypothetical protein
MADYVIKSLLFWVASSIALSYLKGLKIRAIENVFCVHP